MLPRSLIVLCMFVSISSTKAQSPVSNKPNAAAVKVAAVTPGPDLSLPTYTGATKVNFVRTREGMAPITSQQIFDDEGYLRVKQSTQYLDGLGRPLQTVIKQATTGVAPKDIVAPLLYDSFGREVHKFLPYVSTIGNTSGGTFKLTPYADQDNFFKTVYKDANQNLMYDGEQFLYGKTEFEPSPLNRVQKTMAPGNSWIGSNRYSEQQYLTNILTDSVRIWNVTTNALSYTSTNENVTVNIPTTAASYPEGELYKNVTKDEQGNVNVEFKDKEGQVILKKVQISDTIPVGFSGYTDWLCTYYVYDDLNNLRFVIPPKAVEAIRGSWSSLSSATDVINELCFRYEYDSRQRMIAKKVPGAGWVYMVYDKRDRLVYSQDANMHAKNQWMATIYDNLNRPTSTGILTYSSGWAALQSYVDGLTSFDGNSLIVTGQSPSPIPEKITIESPVYGIHRYQSSGIITLVPGFRTSPNIAMILEIVSPGPGPNFSNLIVPGTPPPSGNNFIPLTITHYDDYLGADKTYTDSYNNKLDYISRNGNAVYPEALPSNTEQLQSSTRGLPTFSKVKVLEDPDNLETGKWLTTVMFYDKQGRVIQTQSENYKGGTDVTINYYDFSGKVLSNYMVHHNPQAIIPEVKIKTAMLYDHGGRLLEVWKTINDEDSKKALIVRNEYDELGQLKTKKVGQKRNTDSSYSMAALETLDYNYNIRGWLKGINAAYSHPELISGTNIDRWFGMELNYDWGSGINQYTGNIASTTWRSKGNGIRRGYGFSYDRANRLLSGDYSENSGSGYVDNATVNFDMVMGDGTGLNNAYDKNGNIKAMKQWGLKLNSSPIIDQLTYNYSTNSNKLLSVNENSPSIDNKLGDFTDRNSGTDYGYDRNGNLVTDKNKFINDSTGLDLTNGAITYNHLNLPFVINASKSSSGSGDKGTVTYIYDAAGTKLEKRVHENASGAKPSTDVVTTYIGGMVYDQNTLQFVSHEEGRLRIQSDSSTAYNYDYFIKDHLGNVRMVLTDEISPSAVYQATMEEDNRHNIEVSQFGSKITTTATPKPSGFDSIPDNKNVAVVNGSSPEARVGPGIVLKVMAGDKISANTFAWYLPNGDKTVDQNPATIGTSLLSQFTNGVMNAGKAVASTSDLNFVAPVLTAFMGSQPESTSAPKAYLNWILLEEEKLSMIPESSNATQVPVISSGSKVAVLANGGSDIEIIKNGYIYIYVSNESRQNVYFDDLTIQHSRGPLVEETHYYPFGLTMAGISSKAAGGRENKYKFNKGSELQSKEFTDGTGLDMYDTQFRQLDPQIGRWWQSDPKPSESESPYTSMDNNPITFNDPNGDCPLCIIPILIGLLLTSEPAAGPSVNHSKAVNENQAINSAHDNASLEAGVSLIGGGAKAAVQTYKWFKEFKKGPSEEVKPDKKVPSPNGKKGGEKHQKTIDKVEKDLKKEGFNKTEREVKVETPGGNKNRRFVDVQGTNTKNGNVKQVQVGKQNKNGTPVSRERDALDDIENATGTRPDFIPYNKP